MFHLALGGPRLKNLTINILEGTENASFDLGSHDNIALASSVSLSHTRHSNMDINFSIRNATILFENITKDHAGTYLLNLTYCCVHDDIVENRTEVGNLTLNVLCKLFPCEMMSSLL